MHIDDFILQTMRSYPNREMTRRDLTVWFEETMESPATFQAFHLRDALYRLEAKGKVERFQGINDRAIHWRLKMLN